MKLTNKALIDKAIRFIVDAHEGQYRKNSNLPYVTHVIEVMKRVSLYTSDINVIVAAILHDYIEDCNRDGYTILCKEFNQEIADLVMECTRPVELISREQKCQWLLELGHAASEGAVLIKLSDRWCNTMDFMREQELNKKDDSNYFQTYAAQFFPVIARLITTDENNELSSFVYSDMHFLLNHVSKELGISLGNMGLDQVLVHWKEQMLAVA